MAVLVIAYKCNAETSKADKAFYKAAEYNLRTLSSESKLVFETG